MGVNRYVSVMPKGHPPEKPKTGVHREHKPAVSDKNSFAQHRKEEFKSRHAKKG